MEINCSLKDEVKVKNIVISGTGFWNPGDDFVRDGVIKILKNLFRGYQVNYLFYNFNQDFFPQSKFSGITSMAAKGDLNQYSEHVDAAVIAGLSAGLEINDLYNWIIDANLLDRVYLIGAGYENEYVDKHIGQEPAATIFKNARIITGRTRKKPKFISDNNLSYHHVNCPAILSVPNVKDVSQGKRIEKIAFSIQLPHQIGIMNQSCAESMHKLAMNILLKLSPEYEIEVIAHHKSEYFYFLKLFHELGLSVPVIFSSFYQDMFNIYRKYDLIISTRLHSCLFGNGHGIPGIVLNDTDRHTHCLEGFPHSMWVNSKGRFDTAFREIQKWDYALVAEEAEKFKEGLLNQYLNVLAEPFGVNIEEMSKHKENEPSDHLKLFSQCKRKDLDYHCVSKPQRVSDENGGTCYDSLVRDLTMRLIGTISGDVGTKCRVLNIFNRLTKDYWLEKNIEKYRQLIQNRVPCFDAASFLNWYAENFKPRYYLEIGVRRGRSLAQVLSQSPATTSFGFDMWIPDYGSNPVDGILTSNPGPEFVLQEIRNLGCDKQPILFKGNSHQTLPQFWSVNKNPKQIDLIFVDGDHTYAGAKLDMDICFRHLSDGGALVFDDISHPSHPELKQLWKETKVQYPDCIYIEHSYGMGTGVAFKPPFDHLKQFLSKDICSQSVHNASDTERKRAADISTNAKLPVHFFTIVLNGEPFIRYHIDIFKHLSFKWHWHIIEGVADLKHDTAWSLQNGGRISDELHRCGLSNDGTTKYLDELEREYPENITIYRKPGGMFWSGKLEMVNAPLENIHGECLLWQVDADELWTNEQICTGRAMFMAEPDRTAAYYLDHFFVGEDLTISTIDTYGNNTTYEWLRTWRFKPSFRWATHEPPRLCIPTQDSQWIDVSTIKPFKHNETEANGLVFQHYAYATERQLRFKEIYYGYNNGIEGWRSLQKQSKFPVFLREYFPWVKDAAQVDTIASQNIKPLASKDINDQWQFSLYASVSEQQPTPPTDNCRKILFVRTDSIGDNILAMAMIPHIKDKYPKANITILCQAHIAELYEACPFVDEIVTFDRQRSYEDEEYRSSIIQNLQAINADIALNSVYSREPLTDVFAIGSGAKERIAFNGNLCNISAEIRDKHNQFYSRLLLSGEEQKQELERNRDFLKDLGICAPPLQPIMWTTQEDEQFAKKLFNRNNINPENTIALFPSAQHHHKVYQHYQLVLQHFQDFDLVVLGSKDAMVQANEICENFRGNCVNLTGKTTICQMASVIRKCRIYLGSDSAGAHVACAVGIPNVVLQGGGHFSRFFPYSPLTSTVCLPLECYNCNWQCPYQKAHCISDISPDVIIEAIRLTLKQPADTPCVVAQKKPLWNPQVGQPKWKALSQYLGLANAEIISVGEEQYSVEVSDLNMQGENLFAKGDLDEALNLFTKALDLVPENALTHNNLGVLYYNLGEKDKALNHYQKGAQLQPDNINFQKNLADFYYVEQGRVEEAMQIYVKILNANPEDIETLLVLANICVTLEKFDDAKYFSSRILKIEPENIDVREFLEKLGKCQLSDAGEGLDLENHRDKTLDLQKRTLNQQSEDLFTKGNLEGVSEGLALKGGNYTGKPVRREQKITLTDNDLPMISVITPSLNQGQFIEHSIHSVLGQNYSNFEHIILDGGSTDGTLEILKRYPHLKWLSEKDSGQSEALNKGLRIAKGEIVGWINSDDWYEPGAFEIITSFFKANPTKNVVMGNCNLVDENRIIFDKVINEERGFEELKKYWIGRSIPTQPAVFFRRNLLDEHGYIDENLHYAMDYDLWMRFAQKNYFHHLDVTVANYRFHQAAKGGDQDWSKFVPECKIVFERYTRQPGSSPLISVIVPCFNYGKYLCEAVESVINQTYQNFEIIIINDGSTDNTKEVAESLIAKHPNYLIRLINQENSGQPAISRNRGIQEANGEYILCLDADDMLLPTMLEKCLNTLNQDESIAIAYTDRQDFDGADQIVQARDYDFSQLKYANHISYCALFRKVVWEKIGGYRTNIKVCEDWDFWVAAGAKGFFGRRIPEPLFMYRRHDTGLNQEILKNYNKKFAEIIFNNQEVYTVDDLNHADKLLGQNSKIAPDACSPVSVIVPTFNRPEMLKEALKSILNQTYQNFEIVVVNDCGEGVSDLIDKFQDKRIKYFRHAQNKGLAAARNTGIKNASGQFIALLDDDDTFLPEHLQIALKNLSEKYPVIYTDAIRASYERRGTTYKLLKKNVPYSIDFDRNKLLIGNISPVNCFVFNKNLAVKAGLFDETLSTLEDWEFWIRLSALTPFKHVAQPTVQVNWRTDGTTMTSSRASEFKKNREKIYDRYQSEINRVPNLQAIMEEFQQIWANDWLDQAQLTSIIILTCNQLAFTKKCIDSIYKHTSEPFEFIVVDNGSTDGTIPYLEALSKKRGNKVPIKIIKNRKNLGFAAGNNQGIAASVGDYILLMNNDIVVTPGWLDRLIRCAEQDPAMGIVGPLSNYVSGPQLVKDVSYDTQTLTGLNEFAKRFAAANSGRKRRLIRVVGFCMLVKRAVIEKIGGMDSAYGLGNFEDDDFSLRAALAGFESWMVQDCFVHHFGSRTFIGEQIDYRESLQKNWEIFKQKWKLPAELSYDSGYNLSLLGVTSFDPSVHYIPYQKAVQLEPANPTFQKNLCKVTYLNRQGEDLIGKGDLEGTLDAFKKALEKDPSNATTHNDLGVLYYNQGDKEKALKYYLKAAKLDPENITFQKNIADFYYVEMGKVEEAMQIYVKALNSNPEDIETLLVLAHICVALEKFQDAKVFYSRVLEIEPGHQDALQFLDKLNSMNSHNSGAKTPEELYRQVQPMLNNSDPHRAIAALERLLDNFPDFALAHNELGVLYYHIGDKEKAQHHYERAVELMPENINFQKNLADFYCIELARVEEALKIYVNILITHPQDVETLMATGQICVALEKPDDARDFFNRVLEIEPWNETARQHLEELERPPSPATFLNAESPDEIYQRLKQNLSTLSQAEAIDELEKLLGSYPDFAVGHNDLGVLYYHIGNKEKTLHHYRQAAQLQPDNLTFQKNLADYYLVELDRKKEALQIYLSLLNNHPNDLDMNLTAAHICVAVQNFSKAKVLYKQVLAIDSENEDARNNLRLLEKIKGDLRVDQQPKTESLHESTSEEYLPAKETIGVNDTSEKDIPQFSIIITTSAPLKLIRRCVEGIKKNTSESHEIVFVNNGATKGALKWVRRCIEENPNRRLVKCGKGANPAVCYNTGIKASRGEFIVLLSNDVVVSGGWLSSMLQCFSSILNAGMVGAMTNRAKGRQKVVAAAVNPSPAEINAFAESYRATARYRRIECDILDGFCLLLRCDLTGKIGLFDEQMGALGFEDEDYCLRAALEGYVNQIAGDVYLHRLEHKEPGHSKKNFYLKWSETDVQSPTGKRHLALRSVEKATRAGEEGKIDLAVELFLQAIGLLPEHRESYYKLAEMLANTKRFQDALDVLNEVPDGESDARQLELAACCKEGLELLEEAERYADQALEIDRYATSALNTKGIVAFRRADKNAARLFFTRAMEIDPGFGEAYTNLGALKWAAGLKDEALGLYERGFILSPTIPDVALNYHCAIADLVEYQRAESVVRDAAAIHPHNKKIRYMLIDLLIHQRNDQMAMKEIETAIADFGLDDGILPSALKIREKIGPIKINKNTNCDSTVSLCMIVKDEEDYLARCLQSVRPVVDEIIIVDTGSRDRSRDIANVFGAKVFDFKWAEDFAEARNYSLSKATGKIIFIMDADEVLSPLDYEIFRRTSRQSSRQRSASLITTRNYTMDNNLVGWVANGGDYDIEEAGTGWTPSAKIRLFPNDLNIRFDFPVHEMVEPSLQEMGIAMRSCKFQVHHYGKLNRDKSEKKGEAYYEIGRKKLEEMGDSPIALRELAIQAEGLKKHQEAVELWERFILIVPNEPKAYINMGISYCNLGQFDKVLVTAGKALKLAPNSKEGHYNCALAKLHLGHPDQAIEILEKLCEEVPEYLPARFILAAACCCRDDKKRGMALLKELSGTAIGPGLAIRCHELASRFVSRQRPAYALALLDAAIDCQNTSEDVLDLYANCLKLTDVQKKTGTYV